MQQPPQNPEQPSNPYQPQQTEPVVPPPPPYQQQPYTQYQQPYPPPMQPGMYPPPQQPKKRNRALFWIGGGCLALIVLGIIFAVIAVASAGHIATTAINNAAATITADTSSSTSTSSSTNSGNQVSKVGGTITLNGVQATLKSAKVYNGGAYSSPNPGNEYVLVKVHLRNTSSNDETYNVNDFHLKSGTGNITDPDSLSFDTSLNGLNYGTLAANGGTADGDIVFQMKVGDHKAELTWQPSFFQNAGDNGWILGL
jgi:hypothetical protein